MKGIILAITCLVLLFAVASFGSTGEEVGLKTSDVSVLFEMPTESGDLVLVNTNATAYDMTVLMVTDMNIKKLVEPNFKAKSRLRGRMFAFNYSGAGCRHRENILFRT